MRTSANPKTVVVRARITAEQDAMLDVICKDTGTTISDIIRDAIEKNYKNHLEKLESEVRKNAV